MSKVEYDLDTSGGLMDKIQALIAPPGSEDKKDKGKQDHPYFRKPGKGHNRDCCDACGEGGDLICCDKCPSSFHLLCYDPPLEQTDIPVGEWMCHTCQYNAQQIKPSTSSSSSSSSGAISKPPQTRSKRTLSTPEMSSTKPIKKSKSNPLEVLIEAARSLNPKQFELPRSLSVPCIFPGTDKASKPFSSSSRRNLKLFRKQSISSPGSNNILPLGKCFECRKSCRVAPLLACDFCLLMFHLDCLDPPLASPPQGRWMCPNHVEHALDSKLLNSISASERVSLWDKFTGPVDQDAIKLEFFRTVNRHNPPFRTKVKLGPRNRISVPPMVYYHYQNRVELLPSLRDVLRHEKVVQRELENLRCNADVEGMDESNVEVLSCKSDSALDDFVVGKSESSYEGLDADECMDVDVKANGIFQFSTKRAKVMEEVLKGDLDFKTCDNLIDGALSDDGGCKTIKGKSRRTRKSKKMSFNSSIKDFSNVQKTEKLICNFDNIANGLITSELDRNSYIQNGIHNNTDFIKKEDHYLSMSSNVSEEVDNQLNQLDERLLKLLAYQRIQELLTQSDPANSYFTAFFSNSAQSKFFNVPLPSELLTPEDIERISRIFGNNAKRIIQKPKSNFRVRAMFCPVVSKHFYNIRTSEVNASHVRHDGSFMGYRPTVSARFPEAVAMRYRIMSIGIGPANDLQLERFGHCNFISPKHAVIFHDETTQQFEMLNYSCYGSHVNNVLYSNNETIKHTKKDDKKGGNLEFQVREIIDKRRQINKKNASNEKLTLADSLDKMECSCTCNNNETLSSGWEGSAIINHGSLLRFGCISFVFSYVDCATT